MAKAGDEECEAVPEMAEPLVPAEPPGEVSDCLSGFNLFNQIEGLGLLAGAALYMYMYNYILNTSTTPSQSP